MSITFNEYNKGVRSKRTVAVEMMKPSTVKQRDKYFVKFKNPRQYADGKIKMLRRDMYIEPTEEEIEKLYGLTTEGDIDRAVKGIVAKHWA